MMSKNKLFFIIVLFLAVGFCITPNLYIQAKNNSNLNRQELNDIQRALAYQEIQNLISAHTYCYEAQKQDYEIENFWSERDDISYNGNSTREETTNYYCVTNKKAREAKLKKMSELYPNEVKNITENLGIGDMVIHLVTTPYVVISGDCKTAKGLWYVPSVNVEIGTDGQPVPITIWEKCAVDFIKEKGQWKIWHFNQWVQFAAPLGKNLFDPSFRLDRPFFTQQPNQHDQQKKPTEQEINKKDKDEIYSNKRIADWRPELPEAYETWGD